MRDKTLVQYPSCIACSTCARVFSLKSVHSSSRREKPSRGGDKRTAVGASLPEARGSEDSVAPPVCAHRVVPPHWVGCERCTPSGSAAAAGHEAAAGVVDVPQ